jgi:tetraacyldisaccharide 4'-kinase
MNAAARPKARPEPRLQAPLEVRLEALLQRHWWQPAPTPLMQLLRPMSWLLAALAAALHRRAETLPVPVVVVGNLIVGGAGKTPTVLAVVQALQAAGWRPGVVSRGHGRDGGAVQEVQPQSTAAEVGDEPLLLRRRSGVPLWVGRRRVAAARALCAAHAEVDVLVADDGLQHGALPRQLEVIVFDERGVGNGLRLPAGPLRQALPARLSAHQAVLYNASRATTPLPGALAQRHLGRAVPLADWRAGRADTAVSLQALRGRPLLAAAGIAAPERFFTMLEAEGLRVQRLPLPDHHAYATLPWPADTTDVVTTEKDAVKLQPQAVGSTRVWVVGLDFVLPSSFTQDLLRRLGQPPNRTPR